MFSQFEKADKNNIVSELAGDRNEINDCYLKHALTNSVRYSRDHEGWIC